MSAHDNTIRRRIGDRWAALIAGAGIWLNCYCGGVGLVVGCPHCGKRFGS